MSKSVVIYSDRVEILKDGYNIIEKSIYDNDIVLLANQLLTEIKEEY